MEGYVRYGVYWAPPAGSALARFGAAWLGWDAEAAAPVDHPAAEVDVPALTATPRKYGFHGTLKPPFRLAGGTDVAELDQAAAALAGGIASFPMPALELRRIGRFIALVPSARCEALSRLASACVRGLDRFRAPAGASELARRRKADLNPRQEDNLLRWGYPYVLDEFRFHLTLTGALPDAEAEAALRALVPLTAPFCAEPVQVREICLFGERPDGMFHVLGRHPLA